MPLLRTVADFVAAVVRPEIRALKAYEVAPAGGMIKLDAMENPYPLPAGVRAKIAAAVADVSINRYPDGGAANVKAADTLHNLRCLVDDLRDLSLGDVGQFPLLRQPTNLAAILEQIATADLPALVVELSRSVPDLG